MRLQLWSTGFWQKTYDDYAVDRIWEVGETAGESNF